MFPFHWFASQLRVILAFPQWGNVSARPRIPFVFYAQVFWTIHVICLSNVVSIPPQATTCGGWSVARWYGTIFHLNKSRWYTNVRPVTHLFPVHLAGCLGLAHSSRWPSMLCVKSHYVVSGHLNASVFFFCVFCGHIWTHSRSPDSTIPLGSAITFTLTIWGCQPG